jgi:thioredoxin reductase (NADPH)
VQAAPVPLIESEADVVIVGSGPAGHTAAIYTARAQLHPIMFEGDLANGVAAGGQLTTTTDVENYPGFPDGISGPDICETFRQQSLNCGATIHTETVTRLDLQTQPFEVQTKSRLVRAATVIIATGAVARRLDHAGATEFWQRGISACAVCDGAAPIFRNVPLAVIGGGDTVRILMPPSGSAFSSPVFCVNNLGGDAHSGTRYAP